MPSLREVLGQNKNWLKAKQNDRIVVNFHLPSLFLACFCRLRLADLNTCSARAIEPTWASELHSEFYSCEEFSPQKSKGSRPIALLPCSEERGAVVGRLLGPYRVERQTSLLVVEKNFYCRKVEATLLQVKTDEQ